MLSFDAFADRMIAEVLDSRVCRADVERSVEVSEFADSLTILLLAAWFSENGAPIPDQYFGCLKTFDDLHEHYLAAFDRGDWAVDA